MVRDNIECAFPNMENSLSIFFTLISTKCSQLKHKINPNRTTMRQEKLDSLSLLMIEADLLRMINFDDMIMDFARHKSRKRTMKCKCMFSLIYER